MNREAILDELKRLDVQGKDLKTLYTEISELCMKHIGKRCYDDNEKRAYYLSIEYLMGRMFHNNLLELGVLEDAERILREKGVEISDFEEVEDAALGNGGLGRLAACFLDSAAGCGYALDGYGIRYRYGLFKQGIDDGFQTESPDDWLVWGDPWSVRRESEKRTVHFADMDVTAVPYDMPVIGKRINTLRLFKAEGGDEAEKICDYLYPADDRPDGKILRIRQEYFLAAAAVGELVDRFVKQHGRNFVRFPDYNVLQLNDTHAVLAVAEFIRILHKKYRVSFASALGIAKKTFNYTNHTILPEALECWYSGYIEDILPDIAGILRTVQVYARREWKAKNCSEEEIAQMSVYRNNCFYMANTAVYVAKSVNGVAAIHTDLVKKQLFPAAYKVYPEKFKNVTNGITQRRWLMLCNRELSALWDQALTPDWRRDINRLNRLNPSDDGLIEGFKAVKREKKRQLADYVFRREGVRLLEGAVIYAQVKRLHEYKRQLMTAFAILRLYYDLKEGKLPGFRPSVFLFGAKAASGYFRAKGIIKYLNEIAKLVNSDPQTKDRLQVVFVKNYNVSYAEKIVAGTDVSLQVSTAGFEASGTGNMKFMMNGTVTLGTLDGANIEIVDCAGRENNYIFGATVEEIEALGSSYDPVAVMTENPKVKRVVDTLVDGTFEDGGKGYFRELYTAITEGASWHRPDHYFVLQDLESYIRAIVAANGDYADEREFAEKQLKNAARSAFFSSDRSIADYAEKIWELERKETTEQSVK